MFPLAPPSYILKNISKKGKIKFEIDLCPKRQNPSNPGMVTDAVWVDLNKDGWPDLVVMGQFMPVTVFENHKGIFVDKQKNTAFRRQTAGGPG